MFQQDDTNKQNWGMILNVGRVYSYNKFPDWANKLQKEKFTESGLVVWDDTAKQVINLKARQILWIFDELTSTPVLKHSGIVIGEPAVSISLDAPEKDYKHVLTNQIPLTGSQVCQFFELIEQNEGLFKNMAEEEKEEELYLLASVYKLILSDKRGREESEENNDYPRSFYENYFYSNDCPSTLDSPKHEFGFTRWLYLSRPEPRVIQ